jgi:hypothetical protein
MFRSKSSMAWSKLLRDVVAVKLDITDQDEKVQIFYSDVTDEGFEKMRKLSKRLVEWRVWEMPVNFEIDRILVDNKSEAKFF